jgi:hypothetical protein
MSEEPELTTPCEETTVSVDEEAIEKAFGEDVVEPAFSDEKVRGLIETSEHPEFTKDILEDIKTTETCVPKRTAHTQWSKS